MRIKEATPMCTREHSNFIDPNGQYTVIGLLDHMGWGNLGDAATQEVVINNIVARVPTARFIGFSLVPEDTRRRHNISCFPIQRSYPTLDTPNSHLRPDNRRQSLFWKVLIKISFFFRWIEPLLTLFREARLLFSSYRVIRTLDLLVISGGGQLDDLWPGQPYNVFKFCFLAKLARKKVVLLNVGVATLKRRGSRLFAGWVMRLADYRSVRDCESRERVRRFGVNKVVHVYPDLVYALPIHGRVKASLSAGDRRVVGLNPLGYCDPRIWPRKDPLVYQKYLDKLVRFSVWLLQEGYTLQLFSTDFSVDRYAIEDLRTILSKRFALPEPAFESVRGASDSVTTILREMAGCDYVVTSKYHGLIFSHLLGKPVISLSYESKMDVAMKAVGQGLFAANVEDFEIEWLFTAFRLLVAERRGIRERSLVSVEAYSADLMDQLDSIFGSAKSCDPALVSVLADADTQYFESERYEVEVIRAHGSNEPEKGN